jgi:hypothetical protein
MGYTLVEEPANVSYEWSFGKALSCSTDGKMPEAMQVGLPRFSLFSGKAESGSRNFVVKGGYLKRKNSKRCLVMAGRIYKRRPRIVPARQN